MKACELLADPQKWCKNASTRNDRGERVHTSSPDAVAWCAGAAIWKCYGHNETGQAAMKKLASVVAELDPLDEGMLGIEGVIIADWNDKKARTHAEVLAKLKEADV